MIYYKNLQYTQIHRSRLFIMINGGIYSQLVYIFLVASTICDDCNYHAEGKRRDRLKILI